jgi:hypothetical protein
MAELNGLDDAVRGLTRRTAVSQAGHSSADSSLRMLVINTATTRSQYDLDREASAAMTALLRVESDRQPVLNGQIFQYTTEVDARQSGNSSHTTSNQLP